jgi:formamidopyrimidine-DNA glycosylase
MPELPEVETTRLGIKPHIEGQRINQLVIREPRLRWPIPAELPALLANQYIKKVARRGKYLLLHTDIGTIIAHLGMSGSLRILTAKLAPAKHDHLDIHFNNNICLRFNDPRRFGCFLWTEEDPALHPLLKNLGPEPLANDFDGDYLFEISRRRSTPIKNFIMDGQVVVGVGNIYANEALYYAGIHPETPAGKINYAQYFRLAEIIKIILAQAIKIGGTTIRNFSGSDGKPGYFKQQLKVYGRAGLTCITCNNILLEIRIGQRSTVYCPQCQLKI